MANHIQSILTHWYPLRDQQRWVLASVVHIEGSNYRKTGAMMLINEWGQYYGLISGGCLEKSLLVDVKKVLSFSRPLQVCFDSGENGDMPWALALGCGGKVTILLQPVGAADNYQSLDLLYASLQSRRKSFYAINHNTSAQVKPFHNFLLPLHEESFLDELSSFQYVNDSQGQEVLAITIRPQTHVMVFGGGVDAIPLVQMAHVMGWKITLVDPRVGYAESTQFPHANIICSSIESQKVREQIAKVDAAIIMTHNLNLDAQALRTLENSSVSYIGLLGPGQRKQKVLQRAGLAAHSTCLSVLYGPMGFDIGGDLPESVALSVLAQCHQVLEARLQSRHNISNKKLMDEKPVGDNQCELKRVHN